MTKKLKIVNATRFNQNDNLYFDGEKSDELIQGEIKLTCKTAIIHSITEIEYEIKNEKTITLESDVIIKKDEDGD